MDTEHSGNISSVCTEKQMPLGGDELDLMAAIHSRTLRVEGWVPVIGGSLILLFGICFLFVIIADREIVLLCYLIAVIAAVLGILVIREGWKAIVRRGRYYRKFLEGENKTVVSGVLRQLDADKQSLNYLIGDRTFMVQVPLAVNIMGMEILTGKRAGRRSFRFESAEALLNQVIELHFVALPSGNNILLRADFQDYPGRRRRLLMTGPDREGLMNDYRRLSNFDAKACYILLAICFLAVSVFSRGDLMVWGGTTVCIIVCAFLILGFKKLEKRRERIRIDRLMDKVEVSGYITQKSKICYTLGRNSTSTACMVIVGGNWFLMHLADDFKCGDYLRFAYAAEGSKGDFRKVTGGVDRMPSQSIGQPAKDR